VQRKQLGSRGDGTTAAEIQLGGDAAFVLAEPMVAEALEATVAELERFCEQRALKNAV